MRAVLLIAHGSRRPEANADLAALAGLVRAAGRFDLVEIAYLELAEPDIPTGAARCVEAGATEVRMSPYFLSMGRHVAEDLDRHRREFAARFPGVTFTLCPPLGLHPKVVEVVLERLGEAT
jgi:sirohydrochlorin ferrochelatase